MTTFVVGADELRAVREVRARVLGDHRPASTLVVVQALARPEFLIEIEAVAARS
jgi:enamine deaminase RidA (YjgF/YER057c/UK114 family)